MKHLTHPTPPAKPMAELPEISMESELHAIDLATDHIYGLLSLQSRAAGLKNARTSTAFAMEAEELIPGFCINTVYGAKESVALESISESIKETAKKVAEKIKAIWAKILGWVNNFLAKFKAEQQKQADVDFNAALKEIHEREMAVKYAEAQKIIQDQEDERVRTINRSYRWHGMFEKDMKAVNGLNTTMIGFMRVISKSVPDYSALSSKMEDLVVQFAPTDRSEDDVKKEFYRTLFPSIYSLQIGGNNLASIESFGREINETLNGLKETLKTHETDKPLTYDQFKALGAKFKAAIDNANNVRNGMKGELDYVAEIAKLSVKADIEKMAPTQWKGDEEHAGRAERLRRILHAEHVKIYEAVVRVIHSCYAASEFFYHGARDYTADVAALRTGEEEKNNKLNNL